jgi:hypothetical protein
MTVYLDMDGVLADFFGRVEEVYEVDHWKNLNMDVVIAEIQNTNWFYKLDEYPTAKRLVREVEDMTDGDWGICSSPLRGDFYNSAYWKRRWLEECDFMPRDWKKLVFTPTKEKYARVPFTGEPNILIDDKYSNVDKFNAAGGIGIRYQANEHSIEYVLERIESSLHS